MDSIKNIRLSRLLLSNAEEIQQIITLMNHLKPIDTKQEIFYLKLREVQDIKEHLTEGTIDNLINAIMITEELSYGKVLRMRLLDFFPRVNSIVKQVETINSAEQTSLSSDHSNFKWEAVGGADKLSKFGIYNTLDNLSKGNILKWNEVLDLSYADIFTKLYMDTVKGDLEQEMNLIKTK